MCRGDACVIEREKELACVSSTVSHLSVPLIKACCCDACVSVCVCKRVLVCVVPVCLCLFGSVLIKREKLD